MYIFLLKILFIYFSHSLGGAQALLAALDLYQRDKRFTASNLSIHTVGAPRVGNPSFAYYVDSTGIPFYRSVNDRDIVPHLAPQSFGFLHAGAEVWIRSSSKVCKYHINNFLKKLILKTRINFNFLQTSVFLTLKPINVLTLSYLSLVSLTI